MLKRIIAWKQLKVNDWEKDESKQELVAAFKDEISTIKYKLVALEEKKKTKTFIPKKPELGDERYKKFYHKNAIDILRTLYYDTFHKDLSISFVENIDTLFNDSTLPIYVSSFLIRGEIPFIIMFTANYIEYKPLEDYSIGIKFDKAPQVKIRLGKHI